MTKDDAFRDPQRYGVENPESPGESNREDLPPVSPVSGTGHPQRELHMRMHDVQGHIASESGCWERKYREEREEARREVKGTEE